MRIVIAPDSFKEALAASAAAEAIAEGVMRALPDADFDFMPMADGGEGTVDTLVAAKGGSKAEAMVEGPLGDPVVAEYGILGDGKTAVVEMASASGLALVPADKRNPLHTSSFGTGQVIAQALDCGVERLIVGIGGSATNDGGAGMAQALGVSILDSQGKNIERGGGPTARARTIDLARRHAGIAHCEILVACDVTAPLTGPTGASTVFGPQKGADEKMVQELDDALTSFGKLMEKQCGVSVMELPGAGAAGGLGAGLVAMLGARIVPGAQLIAETIGLETALENADWAFTGEGSFDGQSAQGKVPVAVARLAKKHGVPTIVLAGRLGEGISSTYDQGVVGAFNITPNGLPIEEAFARTGENLTRTAESVCRILAR